MFNKNLLKIIMIPVAIKLCLLISFSIEAKGNFISSGKIQIKTQIAPILPEHFKEVGHARFSLLFWDIYDSRLLTKSGLYPEDKTKGKGSPSIIFEITYLRDITKDDLITNTIEQWQHLDISPKAYQHYIPELNRVWPDITEGDTLSLFIKNSESYFYHNQKFIGVIAAKSSRTLSQSDSLSTADNTANFGNLFLDIWLSPQTSQPKLRKKLLGMMD